MPAPASAVKGEPCCLLELTQAYMLGLVRKVTPGHCSLQSRESRETLREVLKPLAKTLVALAFPPVFPRRLGTEPVAEQGYPSCE